MPITKQIPRADWEAYFERFDREHIEAEPPMAASIELISPRLGDQVEAGTAELLGLAYDPKSRLFEVLLEGRDHLVYHPEDIWVMEEEDGFITALELGLADGDKEILYIHRSGVPARQPVSTGQPPGL
jgi:hypothetical protein